MKKIIMSLKMIMTVCIFALMYHYSQLQFSLIYNLLHYPVHISAVIFICLVMIVFHAMRWYLLNAAQQINLSLRDTLLPTYIAIAYNSVLPGSVGGDFYRLYFVLKKFPEQKSQAVLAIFVDRISGLLGVFAALILSATFYISTIKSNTSLYKLYLLSMSVCFISIALFMLVNWFLSEKLLARITFSHRLHAVMTAWLNYRNSKRVIAESILLSIGTQILLLIVIYILSVAMGLPILSAGIYLIASIMAQIANLIPATPGGIGIGEAAFGNVISMLSPGVAPYATVMFALRMLSTLSYLPGVLIGAYLFNARRQSIASHVPAVE